MFCFGCFVGEFIGEVNMLFLVCFDGDGGWGCELIESCFFYWVVDVDYC